MIAERLDRFNWEMSFFSMAWGWWDNFLNKSISYAAVTLSSELIYLKAKLEIIYSWKEISNA